MPNYYECEDLLKVIQKKKEAGKLTEYEAMKLEAAARIQCTLNHISLNLDALIETIKNK